MSSARQGTAEPDGKIDRGARCRERGPGLTKMKWPKVEEAKISMTEQS